MTQLKYVRRPRSRSGSERSTVRLVAGIVGLAITGKAVHEDSIGLREAAAFRAINRLPDSWYRPMWIVMQLGNLASGPIAGIIAVIAGRPQLARRLVLDGTATWALAKVLKRTYRRPRPGFLLAGTISRGQEASGLGYVSGHTGVAVALGVAAFPVLGRCGRVATVAAVPSVGLSRIYVGAHLPLDVVGGAALGLVVDELVSRAFADTGAFGSAADR